MNNNFSQSVWLSGEICEASGTYFSDICGHPIRKEFKANEMFTRCPTCMQTVRWMRFGGKAITPFNFNTPTAYGISNLSSKNCGKS